uniref:Chromosome 11 open reading frame 57 n=1 Tax=Nothobranchius rachovii TaxID=451742 RepID=A0A1A8S5H7_9TELE
MSKQPMGKTLLRNVIRHTDAHNKIQEEMEMWKMRDWEINTSQHKPFPDMASMRGSMHCDRVPDLSRNRSGSKERVSEHDNRGAQNWTRKLYEFEAKDPDRWGHSGFKELYPEEFESDNEKRGANRKTGRHKMKKSKSDTEAYLSKRSKKSSRKKKKKKKSGDGKRKKDEPSNSDGSSDDRSDVRRKQRKKKSTRGRHKNKKVVKTRGGDEDSSSSGDSGDEKNSERRTNSRKKRKHDSVKDWDSELDSKKKKRKNWKAAGEESSDDSSTD